MRLITWYMLGCADGMGKRSGLTQLRVLEPRYLLRHACSGEESTASGLEIMKTTSGKGGEIDYDDPAALTGGCAVDRILLLGHSEQSKAGEVGLLMH